jgi:protein MPE1
MCLFSATPVAFGRGRGKPVNVPDHPPPPGYLCYRCREKGHWIQACPTNNDPKFDGRYRVKRSTGIPRSLQTKVEKSDAMALDGSGEESKNSGVMVNADGDFVIAQPDKAAWELYQEKAKASAAAAAEAAAAEGSRELHARGLECPIDKRMFLEPTKTPCCQRTYCSDCITNALIDSDFVCPGCSTEGVLLDNLSVDEDAVARIKAYEAEKAEGKKEKEKEKQEQAEDLIDNAKKDQEGSSSKSPKLETRAFSSDTPKQSVSTQSKKRPAEDEPVAEVADNSKVAPAMKKQKSQDEQGEVTSESRSHDESSNMASFPFNQQMPFAGPGFPQSQALGGMSFPDNAFIPGGMAFMNPMMLPPGQGFPNAAPNGWNQMDTGDFGFPQNGMFGDTFNGPMMPTNNFGQPNMFNGNFGTSMPMNPLGQLPGFVQPQSGYPQGTEVNVFSNQQRTISSAPTSREEDNAYFRQPVNPHRHQARQRRIRPSDYREL